MGSTRVVPGIGRKGNILERGTVSVSTENASFPRANLYDGRPSRFFEFSAVGTNDQITCDGTLVQNGGMESFSGTTPTGGWVVSTSGSGAAAQNTTQQRTGASCLSLNRGTGSAICYFDITVRAGEELHLNLWYRVPTAGGTATVRVQNLITGAWLDSSSAWQSTQQAVGTTTSTSYVNLLKLFSVQSLALNLDEDLVTLRFTLEAAGTTPCLFDDVAIYPTWDFASVHGHNATPNLTVKLQSSDDGSTFSDEATFTLAQPAFYAVLVSRQLNRYSRILFQGTPLGTTPIHIGDAIVGQTLTLTRKARWPVTTTYQERQQRVAATTGDEYAHLLGRRAARVFTMEYTWQSLAEYEQARKQVWEASRGGAFPLVLVPLDDEPDVFLGDLGAAFRVSRATNSVRMADLELRERPFPLRTAS